MDVKSGCKIIFLMTIFLFSVIKSTNSSDSNKLNIDILYESRCPDSKNFMQRHLKRVYPKIKDMVKINYVPFGKAYSYDSNDGIRFNCQHGQRECDGNKFQSCVLDVIGSDNQDLQTDFVVCAMDFTKNPQNCAKNIGVNFKKVNECMTSNKGIQLQLKAEQDSTGIIRRSGFVPTIVYNGVYNGNDFWDSLDDFDSIVSNKLRSL
ncbi:GILT-like protein 1 [Chironomus tepperi]|uniref:GILT-like protein 1 n=1 Tax=Chironomus tepperi TaxID=113505 RepID=UPI00391F0738